MLLTSWLMRLPRGMNSMEFEKWYLDRHVDYAKASEGLLRYAIHRTLGGQPDLGADTPYRVAQLWWADEEAIVSSFESYSGSASRGDTALNVTLDVEVHPSMCISSRQYEDVVSPASFDLRTGRYVGCDDGSSYNVLAFGCSDGGEPDGLREATRALREDPRVAEIAFGRSIGKRLQIGLRSSLPGAEQISFDWEWQVGTRTEADARELVESQAFRDAWESLKGPGSAMSIALVRSQELFWSQPPWQ